MTRPEPRHPDSKPSSAVSIPWHEAPERLRSLVARAGSASGRPILVGVSGPVASGKSTLARHLSPCIVATDDYLPDYDLVPYHERDEPRHADFDRLAADLAALKRGEPARIPTWSFHTHRREGERPISPAEVVVVEGIHALYDTVAHLYDLAVFVESPRHTRLARMEDRERSGVRGWGVETARAFFHDVAEPTFERYAETYRRRAHIIVTNH